jgi:hypothetical protein
MRTSLKKSGSGRRTLALLPIGLLIALLVFLRGRSSSPAEKIKSILKAKGYSDRMATWWVAVSNLETGRWTSTLYMVQNLYPLDFNSIDEMIAFMAKKKYFEDPDYLRKVKSRL